MAVARSIFTLDRGFQLFWAAFDMPMTVVSLKVALCLQKFNYHEQSFGYTCLIIIFVNVQKTMFTNPKATFNGTTVTSISKATQNN